MDKNGNVEPDGATSGGLSVMSALARVGGASAFALVAMVAISPVLARLCTQEEFGVYGVFLSTATILAAIAPLGYPEGILAPPSRRQSDALFAASLYSAAVVGTACTAILVLALWLYPGGSAILPWWGGPLLVPTVIGMAVSYSVQIFVARSTDWRAAQHIVVVQACLRMTLQLSFAFLGFGAVGLALAEGLMRSLTAGFGLWRIRLPFAERILPITLREVANAALSYWRFPAIRMPSSFLNNVATLAPTPLIAAVYGLNAAGLWVLVDQVINVPLGFVNKTVGDVFAGYFTRAFHDDPGKARKLFWTTAAALVPIGLIPSVALWYLGSEIFAVAFGQNWRPAGELAGLMAWVLFARFVAQPLSWACNTVNRPEAKLLFDFFQIALVAGVFMFSWVVNVDFNDFAMLLTGAYVLAYIALLCLTGWAITTPRRTVEG